MDIKAFIGLHTFCKALFFSLEDSKIICFPQNSNLFLYDHYTFYMSNKVYMKNENECEFKVNTKIK